MRGTAGALLLVFGAWGCESAGGRDPTAKPHADAAAMPDSDSTEEPDAGAGNGDGDGSARCEGSDAGASSAAFYPSYGAEWNDYVVNHGSDATEASDIACDATTDGPGYAACVHGGEIRAFEIRGQSSCDGLSITDKLGAFDWTCLGGCPVRAVSTGLKAGKQLSDLLDFSTPAFRSNSIRVMDASKAVVFTSEPAVWWNNSVVADNDGMAGYEAMPGTVYVVTKDVTAYYGISSGNVALVVRPGATLTAIAGARAAIFLGDPSSASPTDFNWIEGTVNGNQGVAIATNKQRFSTLRHLSVSNASTSLDLSCANSKIMDFRSNDATSMGFALNGANCHVQGAIITGSPNGMRLDNHNTSGSDAANTGPNTVEDLSISGGTFPGSQAALSVHSPNGNVLRNITITHQPRIGIQVDSESNELDGITIEAASDNGFDGISIRNGRTSLTHARIRGGHARGVYIEGGLQRLDDVQVSSAQSVGVELDASESHISNLVISHVPTGLYLHDAAKNQVWNVMIGDASLVGLSAGVSGMTTGYHSEIFQSQNVISNLYLVNNAEGFDLNAYQSNVFQYLTVANSDGRGVDVAASTGNTFNNLLVANNADTGLEVNPAGTGDPGSWVTDTTFNNLAILDSGKGTYTPAATGIRLGDYATGVLFKGMLLLANNGVDDHTNCIVTSGTEAKTEAGLTDSSVDASCMPVGGSTAAMLDTSISGYGVVGALKSDDTVNQSDTHGAAVFSSIAETDWTRFDNLARMWGPDGSPFPAMDDWGVCPDTARCRIYDWSLRSNDVDVRAVLPLPTGDDFLVHTFVVASGQNECALVPATWTGAACQSTFLIGATEIMDDGIGNDNLLCESDETCLYTPNIGAYQGHGPLVSAGGFKDGTVTGVTLLQYQTNGR